MNLSGLQIPNFRAEANHLMGCKGMEEESLREEIVAYLEKAWMDGLLKGRRENEES